MKEEMRAFGYLCPKCGKPVLGSRSLFVLAAGDAQIACDCGESVLHTEFDGERYHIYVPCRLCGETHAAVCSADRLAGGAVGLACPETKQFCCYIGPEGTVEKQLRELEILAEKEQRSREGAEKGAFVDDVIMYEVLSELKEIAARQNGVTCGCGSGEYTMEIRRSAVDLICRDCGAKLRIPAATDSDLDDLCCHMTLRIPGKEARI